MRSRNCNQEDFLSAYLDGELAENAARELEQHIASCRYCSVSLETLKSNDQALLQVLPATEPPAYLKTQLLERINTDSGSVRTSGFFAGISQAFSFNVRSWAYACAPVFLLAIVISAFHIQHRIENGKILAQIDRSRSEWAVRDKGANPFNIDISGSPLRLSDKNPFEAFLNNR